MDFIHQQILELTSGDDTRAEQAARSLAVLTGDDRGAALTALSQLLGAPDPQWRWWAVRALAEISDPQVSRLLIAALQDPDASVRQCAALGLRLHPDPQATPALTAMLEDQDLLCASLAAQALQAIGKEAVPALIEVMQNGQRQARMLAVRALATIGDPRAIPVLFSALEDDSAWIEYWADQGLERMGVGMTFFNPQSG